MEKEEWVYPNSRRRKSFGDEVPDNLKNDYFEACDTLLVSPKSSATLSRRVLQVLLHEQGYDNYKLDNQIKALRNEEDPERKLHSSLLRIVDAVRQFGNFSAHQKINVATREIIEVEPEEAEICLEIVEGLFDHYYVRPAVDEKKMNAINEKLQQAGKFPL